MACRVCHAVVCGGFVQAGSLVTVLEQSSPCPAFVPSCQVLGGAGSVHVSVPTQFSFVMFSASPLYKRSQWRSKLGGFIHFVLKLGGKQESYTFTCK